MRAERAGPSAIASIALVLGALVLWSLRLPLALVFGGALLAVFLDAASEALRTRISMPRGLALAVVAVALAGATVGALWFRGSDLANGLDQLQQRLPPALVATQTWLAQNAFGRWLLDHLPDARSALTQGAAMRVAGIFSSLAGIAGAAFVVGFTAIYFVAEPSLYIDGALALVSPSRRARFRTVAFDMRSALRAWLVARVVSMIAVGVLATIGLVLLGIPLATTLGVLAALLTFVPNVGPLVSALLPAILALAISPGRALAVLVLFLIVHALEGYVITPLLERRIVQLPPVLTLLAQIALAAAVGAIGVALAAPIAVTIVVLVRRLYVEDTLGDLQQACREP